MKRYGWGIAALLLVAGLYRLGYASLDQFFRSIDFNQEPFEDFMGPYYTMAQRVMSDPQPVRGFLYGPTLALLLAPLATLGPQVASWFWLGVQLVALVALIGAARALIDRPGRAVLPPAIVAVLLAFPVAHNFHWGQVSVPIVAAVLWALVFYRRGHVQGSALLLGLVAAIKVHPLIFLAFFAVRREWRMTLHVASATVLFALIFPSACLGLDATLEFYRAMAERIMVLEIDVWRSAPNQTTLAAFGARHWGEAWYLPLSIAGWLVTALALVWVGQRRTPRDEPAFRADVLLVLLLTPLWLKPAWPHYYGFLAVCQLYALQHHAAPLVARLASVFGWFAASMITFRLVADPVTYAQAGWLLGAALVQLVVHALWVMPRSVAASPAAPGSSA